MLLILTDEERGWRYRDHYCVSGRARAKVAEGKTVYCSKCGWFKVKNGLWAQYGGRVKG